MNIIDYLVNNKEWMFSGIGVVVLGFVLTRLWPRIFHRGEQRSGTVIVIQAGSSERSPLGEPRQQYAANITKVAAITLAEIVDALEKAPPLQREDVAKRYEGLIVQWETKLWNAEMIDDDNDDEVRLTLDFGPGNTHLVYCNVKLSDYKELGVLPKGSPITVMGKISRVQGEARNYKMCNSSCMQRLAQSGAETPPACRAHRRVASKRGNPRFAKHFD